jgi:malonyl-CoA/methylmalonyl-CoA synthetase
VPAEALGGWSAPADARALPPPGADELALLLYTSGTTGRSKGAMLSHRNLGATIDALHEAWGWSRADELLLTLPLFHLHGLVVGLFAALAAGATVRLERKFDAGSAIGALGRGEATLFFGVPTLYVRLVEELARLAPARFEAVRLFVSGSAPLSPETFEAFRAATGHEVLERYGMTETGMLTSNRLRGPRRPGSVGVPLPGVELRVVDARGVEAPAGTEGEVEVRGPNVFSGYWGRPDATAAAFVDGWFRTGDLAERSADGYYTLRGRRTELIISGGFNIYPREIEELLSTAPGIREAVVVGVPDERRGELPVAYIVADGTVDKPALEQLCRRSLASFKVPRAFIRLDALPRTALGKVQKHLLPPWRG